jgi:hypothetical protein
MPPMWLNQFTSTPGVWFPGQDDIVEITLDAQGAGQPVPPGATVRLYETSVGGYVTLSPSGGELTVCGDPQVFIRIDFTNNTYRYLSAPLRTPVEVSGVDNLALGIAAPVGPASPGPITEVRYRIVANAHLVYEVL